MREEILEVHREDIEMTIDHAFRDGFTYLSFITAVDEGENFRLFWRFVRLDEPAARLVEATVPREDPVAPTATRLYKGADWHEREIYDLFGIWFEGHPNLKRIFLPDGFEGHPLRKDFESPEVEKRPEGYY
jgi:NADH-quinone oxidoreductase subunit C